MQAVHLETQFVVRGGLSKKTCVLDTMEIATPTGTRHFCKVNKNDSWLLKCSAGREARKGVLKRSRVLETLKKKLGVVPAQDPELTESTSAPSEEVAHDPMNDLDVVAEGEAQRSPKKLKYYPKRVCNRIQKIAMPMRPPESARSAVAGHCTVHAMARGTNQLWIAVEDVTWLVNYVADEVALGGVAEQQDESDTEGNCELPLLRMKYDFAASAWQANFVDGPLRGETFTSSVANMSAEKWATVQAAVAVEFENATLQQVKEGTRLFLKNHCETVLAQHDSVDDCGRSCGEIVSAVADN